MNFARLAVVGLVLGSVPASAQSTDAPKPASLAVPTNAFFGSITGTVSWPKTKNIGKPRDAKTACSKITVRAMRKDQPDPGEPPTMVEVRSVRATGGTYPADCKYKLDNVRIRQDLVIEARFPADDWVNCNASFSSAPSSGAKWKNPVSLPRSQELKAPLALAIACAK